MQLHIPFIDVPTHVIVLLFPTKGDAFFHRGYVGGFFKGTYFSKGSSFFCEGHVFLKGHACFEGSCSCERVTDGCGSLLSPIFSFLCFFCLLAELNCKRR